jgi:collagenase-like PrtC family protease
MTDTSHAKLSMGPVLFNWPAERWRDFYFRLADEAPLDAVYLGEVVCAKRWPYFVPVFADVVERLQAGGKQVIFSTLALIMNKAEREALRAIVADNEELIEVNDVAALTHLQGRPPVVGPLINCYNEATRAWFARHGAKRVCLPVELSQSALAPLAAAAAEHGVELEMLAFGRMPLAVSARCYHARAHRLTKDSCQFVCNRDADGLVLKTLDGADFLAVNGIQTMSYAYLDLLGQLDALRRHGVSVFRLSPHSFDMLQVARLFRRALDGDIGAEEAARALREATGEVPLCDGYLFGAPGVAWHPGAPA